MTSTTDDTDDAATTQAEVDWLCGYMSHTTRLRIRSYFQDHHILQLAEAVKKTSAKVIHLLIILPCQSEAVFSVLFHELTPSLRYLQVEEPSREVTSCLLRLIGGTTSVTSLTLHGGLPEHTLTDLVDALLTNTSISALDIEGNEFGNSEMELLANLLQHSTTLERLLLDGNRIVDIQSISEASQHNRSLRMLCLMKNDIADLEPLAQVLESSNFVLEEIYFSSHSNRFRSSWNKEGARIEHYLKLNRAGRRLLHGEDITSALYPHILARVSNNSSLLFGLVRELPQAWTG